MKFNAKTLAYIVAGVLTMVATSGPNGDVFVPIVLFIALLVFPVWGLIVHGGSDVPTKGGDDRD